MTANTAPTRAGLVPFLIIAFLWSWVLWLPGVLASRGVNVPDALRGIGMLAVFGPSAAAVIVTARLRGKAGVKALLRRGVAFNFRQRWLLPALLLAPASAGVSLLIASAVTGDGPALPALAILPQLVLMFFIGGPLAEEFGWRGFALERLQHRWGALRASLWLGLAWGLWHLPLHFSGGSVQENIPVWANILIIATSSLLFTWLYNHTGGSIAVAMLFHWSVNAGNMVFPYWQAGGEGIAELPNLWTPTAGMLIGYAVLLATVVIVWLAGGLKRPANQPGL